MPLRLNVGLQKKVGQPDYGSLGASCNVELELPGSMIFDDLDGFHRHVANAFVACRQAVDDELARSCQQSSQPSRPAGHQEPANGNGHGAPAGNGHRASTKQLSYARQLAGQITDLGARRLESVAQRMFGKPLAGLSSLDASGLIDMLKSIKAGEVSLADAVDGAAV